MFKLFLISFCCLFFIRPAFAKSPDELYWYLASSMIKPGRDIVHKFNSEHKNIKVLLISGGSGELLSKILASGKGDIYTPASKFFLDKALTAGVVKNYSKLLEQKPVFGLAKKLDEKNITFDDIVSKPYKLAVGNPKTMALGQTFVEIKQKMGEKLSAEIKKMNSYMLCLLRR